MPYDSDGKPCPRNAAENARYENGKIRAVDAEGGGHETGNDYGQQGKPRRAADDEIDQSPSTGTLVMIMGAD